MNLVIESGGREEYTYAAVSRRVDACIGHGGLFLSGNVPQPQADCSEGRGALMKITI